MIRLIQKQDLPDIRHIWHICFGDSAEFINQFYHFMNQRQSFVSLVDNQVVACLFVLDATYQGKKFGYVYACATHPQFRKQGHMHDLLETAYNETLQRGLNGLLLVPAQPELFNYYEKCGYSLFSKIKKVDITAEPMPNSLCKSFSLSIKQVKRRRDLYFGKNTVKFDTAHLQFACTSCDCLAVGIQYLHKMGYAICQPLDNGVLAVRESCFGNDSQTDLQPYAHLLGTMFSCQRLQFWLPEAEPYKQIAKPYAMVRSPWATYQPSNYLSWALE